MLQNSLTKHAVAYIGTDSKSRLFCVPPPLSHIFRHSYLFLLQFHGDFDSHDDQNCSAWSLKLLMVVNTRLRHARGYNFQANTLIWRDVFFLLFAQTVRVIVI